MAASDQRTAQLHIRVTRELKRAVKMHCASRDTTEQEWVSALVEAELAREAPDLWRTDVSSQAGD